MKQAILKVIGAFSLGLVSAFVSAFAISAVWNWFFVPVGAPEIGMLTAYGVSVFGAMFTMSATITTIVENYKQSMGGTAPWWFTSSIVIVTNLILLLLSFIAVSIFG